MRAYLPLTGSELSLEVPPDRLPLVAQVPSDLSGEEQEAEREYVLEDASFASLQALQDSGGQGGRVVAVGEVTRGNGSFTSWEQIDSLMVDGEAATAIVQQILRADDEDEANLLVEALFEEPLEWFDISERLLLAQRNSADSPN